jgi:hypothetical protein
MTIRRAQAIDESSLLELAHSVGKTQTAVQMSAEEFSKRMQELESFVPLNISDFRTGPNAH